MSEKDMKTPTVFGVSAVLKTEQGFAVIRELKDNQSIGKKAGMVSFPSGFTRPGEHPEQTARRELQEETGLDAHPVAIIGFYLISGGFGIAYEMRLTAESGQGSTDKDVADVRFLSSDEILKLETRPAVKQILQDYLRGDRFALDAVVDCR